MSCAYIEYSAKNVIMPTKSIIKTVLFYQFFITIISKNYPFAHVVFVSVWYPVENWKDLGAKFFFSILHRNWNFILKIHDEYVQILQL